MELYCGALEDFKIDECTLQLRGVEHCLPASFLAAFRAVFSHPTLPLNTRTVALVLPVVTVGFAVLAIISTFCSSDRVRRRKPCSCRRRRPTFTTYFGAILRHEVNPFSPSTKALTFPIITIFFCVFTFTGCCS